MLNYAIVQIKGKQYKVEPNKTLLVDLLKDQKTFESDKVLLKMEDNKLSVGTPYLKDKLNFEVLENIRGKKLRVSKYHAKANYRKVIGFRTKYSKIKLI